MLFRSAWWNSQWHNSIRMRCSRDMANTWVIYKTSIVSSFDNTVVLTTPIPANKPNSDPPAPILLKSSYLCVIYSPAGSHCQRCESQDSWYTHMSWFCQQWCKICWICLARQWTECKHSGDGFVAILSMLYTYFGSPPRWETNQRHTHPISMHCPLW